MTFAFFYSILFLEDRKMEGKIEMKKEIFKKTGEELQQYLHFRKRGSVVANKKGKGSYNRQKMKRGS